MPNPLRGKDLISLNDLRAADIEFLFSRAAFWKKKKFGTVLKNKTVVLLFAKPSTRTRVSFETATFHLGGHAIVLDQSSSQIGRGESIKDTAHVLSRYNNAIVARLFAERELTELAKHASIPVINALTNYLHPCQALADYFTIKEHFGKLKGLTLAYLGDGNSNVVHSLIHAGTKLGVHVRIGCPPGYEPERHVIKHAHENGRITGSKLTITTSPKEAVQGADIVYTDTWVSMGEEKEAEKRDKLFRPYQLNKKILALAKPNAIVMHDMPAHRGFEITDEVMDGSRSLILEQAENRLHTEKAVLEAILG